MRHRILKYILDIEQMIVEIETIISKSGNDFDNFKGDFILQRAMERDLQIIGEAVRKIIELEPSAHITSAKNIIGLRNIISHAYDSVEPELIWDIIQTNVPQLKKDIDRLKNV